MVLSKFAKILLLFYLSIAVLFPSYQGYENGQEFHFFGIFETYAEYHHHSRPEIEASHDREHSHSLLAFCTTQRTQRFGPNNGKTQLLFIPPTGLSIQVTRRYIPLLSFSKAGPTFIFEKKTSGLSPPVS